MRKRDNFRLYPVLYGVWNYFLTFSLPSYKMREEEKENEVAKPVFIRMYLKCTEKRDYNKHTQ